MEFVLIARHYPPEASGGARRPYLTARGLREAGHTVRVVTPFAAQHPDDIEVPGPPPAGRPGFQANSLKTWLVRWRYWPDPEIAWARAVSERLRTLAAPDWLITTSPPESTHSAGAALKAHWQDTRWMAEFRDTWTVAPHRREAATWPRRPLERRLARRILRHADLVSAVSPFVLDEVKHYAPRAVHHIEGHFADPPPSAFAFPPDTFDLVHSGGFALSDHRRHLGPVLARLDPIAQARPQLRLHIAGWLDEAETALAAARPWVVPHGLVDLATSRAMQAGADALLLATPPDSHALPGKFAEYAQATSPIVAVGDGDWRNLLPGDLGLLPLEALTRLEAGTSRPPLASLSHTAATARLLAILSQF